jgi:hypothetical protein
MLQIGNTNAKSSSSDEGWGSSVEYVQVGVVDILIGSDLCSIPIMFAQCMYRLFRPQRCDVDDTRDLHQHWRRDRLRLAHCIPA